MNDIELYEPECRICFDQIDNDELISPCRCKGTSKWVHRGCLNKWRMINKNREPNRKCMECREEYVIRRNGPEEKAKLFGYTKLFIIYNFFVSILFGIVWTLINNYLHQQSPLLYLLNGGKQEPSIQICEYNTNHNYTCRNSITISDQMRLPYGYYVNVIFHVYFLLSLNSIIFTLFYYKIIRKNIVRIKLYYNLNLCYLVFWNLYIFRFFILYYLSSRLFYEPSIFFGVANLNIFLDGGCYYNFFQRHEYIVRHINNNFLEDEYVLNWSENPINEFEYLELDIPEIGDQTNIDYITSSDDSDDSDDSIQAYG
tara:strand:+ start:1516 stop:2454 length:939 start_codon:yes stop_codon:yes gene_type:complete